MFLRCSLRRKDGKERRCWSIVENRRCSDGRIVQRQVLYLGEIKRQPTRGLDSLDRVFDEDARCQKKLQLFAPERTISPKEADAVQVRLSEVERLQPGLCVDFKAGLRNLGPRGPREKCGKSA